MEERWIAYTSQNIPGSQSFELDFHSSITSAVDAFRTYCREVGTTDCTMVLYYAGNDQSMYDLAREYKVIGCPFDHADRYLEFGPRGGVRVEHC